MSSSQETPQPAKPAINKKQLLADVIAFSSIITSYFFISLTLHFNIFESQFGLALNSPSTITMLYLSYSALVVVFKLTSTVLSFIKKAQQENDLGTWINNELSFSLLNVLVVSSIYIFVHISSRPFTIEEFCHLALWLWISEVIKILGGLLGRVTGITSFDYLGKSIGVILLLGGLVEPFGAGIFTFF